MIAAAVLQIQRSILDHTTRVPCLPNWAPTFVHIAGIFLALGSGTSFIFFDLMPSKSRHEWMALATPSCQVQTSTRLHWETDEHGSPIPNLPIPVWLASERYIPLPNWSAI